jgi:hypothetical protein
VHSSRLPQQLQQFTHSQPQMVSRPRLQALQVNGNSSSKVWDIDADSSEGRSRIGQSINSPDTGTDVKLNASPAAVLAV